MSDPHAAAAPVLSSLGADGALLKLTLNTPKANVLDTQMIETLMAALGAAADSRTVKAIAIEGAGRHFSFGASVEEHQRDRVADMLPTFHALFGRLMELSIPTMAVVRGQCLGGGLELAGFCTWIFASQSAFFGQPEIKLGVIAPMASVLLPWRLGARGLDLLISGRSVSADEARDLGLVHAVGEDPAAMALSFFEEHLAPLSTSSLRFAERAARLDLAERLRRDLPTLERLYIEELMATEDANEGITAFLERRPPHFIGR